MPEREPGRKDLLGEALRTRDIAHDTKIRRQKQRRAESKRQDEKRRAESAKNNERLAELFLDFAKSAPAEKSIGFSDKLPHKEINRGWLLPGIGRTVTSQKRVSTLSDDCYEFSTVYNCYVLAVDVDGQPHDMWVHSSNREWEDISPSGLVRINRKVPIYSVMPVAYENIMSMYQYNNKQNFSVDQRPFLSDIQRPLEFIAGEMAKVIRGT